MHRRGGVRLPHMANDGRLRRQHVETPLIPAATLGAVGFDSGVTEFARGADMAVVGIALDHKTGDDPSPGGDVGEVAAISEIAGRSLPVFAERRRLGAVGDGGGETGALFDERREGDLAPVERYRDRDGAPGVIDQAGRSVAISVPVSY